MKYANEICSHSEIGSVEEQIPPTPFFFGKKMNELQLFLRLYF